MEAKKILSGAVKVLKNADIKNFGRECIRIGRGIQKNVDYKKYKTIAGPIIKGGFKSKNKEMRSVAGKLLQGYKKFK